MSEDLYDRLVQLSPERLALLALEQQERLDALQPGNGGEPVAIVGMGCRLPGAPNLQDYWEVLRDGVDAVSEISPDRWDVDQYYDPDPDVPGRIATRWAGLLKDIDRFDPHFFGISPREARTLDPQQRLLLEVAWEALEHACIPPDTLRGSATGTYIGLCNADYGQLLLQGDARSLDMYLSTGNADSVASGRLAYVLGLQGPALSIDTACSSSLVATHLAVQGLRTGDCDVALAGGVNIILSPKTTMTLSQAKMMAADGRCKAFDSRADGFVRGEGCGVLVLKRLSDAESSGDRILAVIRGSAVNQDGRSNGLTAPNGPSQVAVLSAALRDADVEPADVGYVEAHGTGTSLGDPIEAQSLGAVLGNRRGPDDRLVIGSAKTNLGHLESAAGVAGLIKVVLSMEHGEIPPSLHLVEPNPYIPWDRLPIDVATERRPWPENGRALAGVSSFGFSGTNAHIVLEPAPIAVQEPAGGQRPTVDRPATILPISATEPAALVELVEAYEQLLGRPVDGGGAVGQEGGPWLAEVAAAAARGRSHHGERLALVARDREEARRLLADVRAGNAAEHEDVVAVGRAASHPPRVAFMFTGHGSQYPEMGVELYRSDQAYRAAMDECAGLVREISGRDVIADIGAPTGADDSHPLDSMACAQPAVFAVEYAVASMWRSWGVEPDVVLGHSVGEYVAAVVAGVMPLEDGVRLVCERGRLMDTLPAGAAMAVILASEQVVVDAIGGAGLAVHVAAVNGPQSVAVAGTPDDVAAATRLFADRNVEVRPLNIPIAAHSPQIDPILDEFERAAATVRFSPPTIEVISGRTGRKAEGDDLVTARYWRDHLRQPVRFADAFLTAHQQGVRLFVEAGPHPTLLNMGRHIVEDVPTDTALGAGNERAGDRTVWLPSLRSGHEDWRIAYGSLARLYTAGAPIDWAAVTGGHRPVVTLPTYPFQRDRYWASAPDSISTSGGEHPLLGRQVESPALDRPVFETELGASWPEWLDHHRVHGAAIVPSPALLTMALTAAAGSGRACDTVEHFLIQEPLILPEDGSVRVQVVLSPDDGPGFEILSRDDRGDGWTLHATGQLVTAADGADASFNLAVDDAADEIDGGRYYDHLARFGLQFGAAFRGLRTVWADDREALGLIEPSDVIGADLGTYALHPALLDACFHLIGGPRQVQDGDQVALLVGIERFTDTGTGDRTGRLWCRAALRPDPAASGSFEADVQVQDDDGIPVAVAEGVHLRLADRAALRRTSGRDVDDRVHRVMWVPSASATGANPSSVDAYLDSCLDQVGADWDGPDHPGDGAADLARYVEFMDVLEGMASAYARSALEEIGDEPVPDRHRPLLSRLRALTASDSEDRIDAPSPETIGALGRQYPEQTAEIAIVERCGRQLADVVRGTVEPLDLLFPGGDQSEAERLYGATPVTAATNDVVAAVTARLAARPGADEVRILEVGGGTGATTVAVLDALRAHGVGAVRYLFTDIGPSFVARASERFPSRAGDDHQVDCAVLDLDGDLGAQGVDGPFDVIIAANVLHATADLRSTVGQLRRVLSDDGALVMVEGVKETLRVTTTFGLTDGWWRFADTDLRVDHPLLGHRGWLDLLAEAGFETARSITDQADGDVAGQSVFVARVGDAARTGEVGPVDGAEPTDVVIGTAGPLRDELRAELTAGGRSVTALDLGPDAEKLGAELAKIDGIARVVLLAPDRTEPVANGNGTGTADGAAALAVAADASVALLTVTTALLDSAPGARLWAVTRGAQPAGADVTAPELAAIWGLGRVVSLEHPELWGGLIDLAAGSDLAVGESESQAEAEAGALADVLNNHRSEDQFALRGGEVLVPRLSDDASLPAGGDGPQTPIDAAGAYLVTGGLGGLGIQVGRWLAANGAAAVLLTGRRGLPDRDRWLDQDMPPATAATIAAVQEIESCGTRVVVAGVDVADVDAMSSLIDRCGSDLPPLRGVFHCAATLDNRPVAELDGDAMTEMLRPKVAGTWALDAVTTEQPLDFVVLFSSTTALWGSAELGHYAAANAVLDSYAHHRQAAGAPWTTVNWGTWDEMRAASDEERDIVSRSGLRPLPSKDALDHLMRVIIAKPTQTVIVDADWQILKPLYEIRRPRPFLSLVGKDEATTQAEAGSLTDGQQAFLADRLAETPLEMRAEVIEEFLADEVARALEIDDPYRIDVHQGLFDMGLDSLMSVELKGRIDRALGLTLPSTLTFNYPTIAELTTFLNESMMVDEPPAEPTPGREQPIAVTPEPVADDLDEDELESLLADRLAKLQDRLGDRP